MPCRSITLLLLLSIAAGLSACAPAVPIPVLEYQKSAQVQQTNLLILLRGRGGSYRDFEKFGIVQEVKKRNLPFDIVVPDAHFWYYMNESLHERLKYDIIDPAKDKGYKNIWLAGFSMGALGGLFYLIEYPDNDIAGVLLCSPFLGYDVPQEINSQGGIAAWSPPSGKEKGWQYRLWNWVKGYQNNPAAHPPIILGYAEQDSITGQGPTLLATALSEENVFSLPGGHDYPTFQAIWRQHMDRLELQWRKLSDSVASSIE